MDSEGKMELHPNTSPSLPIRREPESLEDFEHLDHIEYLTSDVKEGASVAQNVQGGHSDLNPSSHDVDFDDLIHSRPSRDLDFDFPEQKPSAAPFGGLSHERDPLDDFLGGDRFSRTPSSHSDSQHFAEPPKMDYDSPKQLSQDIADTQSFLHHEVQLHHIPAAGDSTFQLEKKDDLKIGYGKDDLMFGEPSPNPSPEPPRPHFADPLDDFLSGHSSPPQPVPELPRDPTPEPPVRKPAPVREPTPEPPVREPTPVHVRAPTPELPVREPSPVFVREPSPEPIKAPTPEPIPPPRVLPTPPQVTKPEKQSEKTELRKEPTKPTSPPPAPPKRESSAKSCEMGIAAWFQPQRLHPQVEALVYWRDPKKSGALFGSIMVVLLSLSFFSLISVIANLSLLALTATFGFRMYKTIMQAIQKTSDGHPFKEILEADLSLPPERVRQTSEVAVAHINATLAELRRLFLVEDIIDSLKFGVALWMLTYVGAWFNGMTLIILGVVALFTLPKVYESNKAQIDQNIDLVRSKVNEITAKVKAAIPIGKKAEEKKEQ